MLSVVMEPHIRRNPHKKKEKVREDKAKKREKEK